MTLSKRLLDLIFGFCLSVLLLPVISFTAIIILIIDGRPVFYISERMKTPDIGFNLLKFRTMKNSVRNSGVSGGDKVSRITRTGPFLRRTRLDELPQLWNVLAGDMSFIGPRPPLRQYVERFPEIYEEVLKSRPGVSGLASIHFHAHEAYLLSGTTDAEQTDDVYTRRCIPRKYELDIIYQENRSICFDLVLMFRTVFRRRR